MSIHEIHVFEWDWNELSGNDPCRYECHWSSSEKGLKNAFFRPFLLLPKQCFQPWGSFNFQTLIIIKIIVIFNNNGKLLTHLSMSTWLSWSCWWWTKLLQVIGDHPFFFFAWKWWFSRSARLFTHKNDELNLWCKLDHPLSVSGDHWLCWTSQIIQLHFLEKHMW